jgi:hypothetical protein
MSKNNVYPLIAPAYPTFVPVAPNTKKTATWREWGRSPKPGVISIGLPRASQQPTPSQPADVWQPAPTKGVGPVLKNMQTIRVIEDIEKRNGNK